MHSGLAKLTALAAGVAFVVALGACSIPTQQFTGAKPIAAAKTTSIFVASLRGGLGDEAAQSERSDMLSFSVHTVSQPPARAPGTLAEDRAGRDPRTEFVDVGATRYAEAKSMMTALAGKAKALGTPREVMVFVHGFNNSFAHGLNRLAEIDADYNAPIAKVLFDWPTDSELLNYAHDLDSAAFSRDGLEQLIDDLAAADFRRIVLVGYSMGADIIMETLRQMRIGKKDKTLARIGGVVMIAPDIDVDVFLRTVSRAAPLPQPFVIYASPDDWPLRTLQDWVYGGKQRLGVVDDISPIAELPLIVVTAPTKGPSGEGRHLATSSTTLIAAANRAGADLASFGPLAKNVPGASVETEGAAIKVALP